MPYVNKPRPYKKEYEQYDGTEKVKKKRAERNKARRIMMEAGQVQKGDGEYTQKHLKYHPNHLHSHQHQVL